AVGEPEVAAREVQRVQGSLRAHRAFQVHLPRDFSHFRRLGGAILLRADGEPRNSHADLGIVGSGADGEESPQEARDPEWEGPHGHLVPSPAYLSCVSAFRARSASAPVGASSTNFWRSAFASAI